MCVLHHVESLAKKIQSTWEVSERLFYRNLAISAPCPDTRTNCNNILRYMSEGIHDFRRHYQVDEYDGHYRIVYRCNVSSMPKIHCVVNKETGDVARYSLDLINETCFQYNLSDPRSREVCLSVASYDSEYLK